MSSNFPISVRIASKTRSLETTGNSSYYYSSQLITNIALLRTLKKLGQQLSWPAKTTDTASITKHGSTFLTRANQSVKNSRMEPFINLIGTPGKEWLFVNLKLIDKLSSNQQFFNYKTIGLLAKGLGYSGRFNSVYLLNEGRSLSKDRAVFSENKETWFKSFNLFTKLAKYCTSKYYKRAFISKDTTLSKKSSLQNLSSTQDLNGRTAGKLRPNQQGGFSYKAFVNSKFSSTYRQNTGVNLHLQKNSSLVTWDDFEKKKNNFYFATILKKKGTYYASDLRSKFWAATKVSLNKKSQFKILPRGKTREQTKQSFNPPIGLLPFYFTALGLITHSQVLRNTLVIAPIISGSLQSNLALADHKKALKIASSSGLGLISTSPYCYIVRNPKRIALNFFFQIPAKLTEKKLYNRPQYHQVYLLAELQGLRKSQKKVKSTYASVRLKLQF